MFRLPCLFLSFSYSTGVERTPLGQPPHQLKVFEGDRGRFGGGKRGLSPESPLFPSPNPSPSPPKTFDLIESLSSVFPIGRRPSFERWSFKCRNGAGNPHREEEEEEEEEDDDDDDDEDDDEDDELSSFFLSIKKLPKQREAFFRPNLL